MKKDYKSYLLNKNSYKACALKATCEKKRLNRSIVNVSKLKLRVVLKKSVTNVVIKLNP